MYENVGCAAYLSSFTVVFIFAGEPLVLESVQNFANGFSGLGQHGFERYARGEFACLA